LLGAEPAPVAGGVATFGAGGVAALGAGGVATFGAGGVATFGAGRNGLAELSDGAGAKAGAGEAVEVVPPAGTGGLAGAAGAAKEVDEAAGIATVSASAPWMRMGSPTSAPANKTRNIMQKIRSPRGARVLPARSCALLTA